MREGEDIDKEVYFFVIFYLGCSGERGLLKILG